MYIERYEEMRNKFEQGDLEPSLWDYFCRQVLEELMIENKDVLERLKK